MSKRRIFLGIIVFFAVILISGCSLGQEKKLNCTANASGVDVGFNISFKGNKITDMQLTYDMDLSAYSDEQIESLRSTDFCEVVKNSLKQYESAFKNCKDTISNKKLSVKSDLDINTMAQDEKEKLADIDAAKEGLESAGYTCTIY